MLDSISQTDRKGSGSISKEMNDIDQILSMIKVVDNAIGNLDRRVKRLEREVEQLKKRAEQTEPQTESGLLTLKEAKDLLIEWKHKHDEIFGRAEQTERSE